MTRVQIPAYTDHWLRGDRYGDVLRIDHHIVSVNGDSITTGVEMASVRLDKSGKRARFILDDCEVMS
jgi:hypothetical protein